MVPGLGLHLRPDPFETRRRPSDGSGKLWASRPAASQQGALELKTSTWKVERIELVCGCVRPGGEIGAPKALGRTHVRRRRRRGRRDVLTGLRIRPVALQAIDAFVFGRRNLTITVAPGLAAAQLVFATRG